MWRVYCSKCSFIEVTSHSDPRKNCCNCSAALSWEWDPDLKLPVAQHDTASLVLQELKQLKASVPTMGFGQIIHSAFEFFGRDGDMPDLYSMSDEQFLKMLRCLSDYSDTCSLQNEDNDNE